MLLVLSDLLSMEVDSVTECDGGLEVVMEKEVESHKM